MRPAPHTHHPARTAALPMYDLPEVRADTDAWWRGLARHFRAAGLSPVPARRAHPAHLPRHWLSRSLLFSQTCGLPLSTALAGKVRYLASPCHALPGCTGPWYDSAFMVREWEKARVLGDMRGCRFALNGANSQSGFNAMADRIADLADRRDGGGWHGGYDGATPFFARGIRSGSHRASLALLRDGAADLCAIDGVTLALIHRHAPAELAGLRVLARSRTVPSLPYITAVGHTDAQVARLRQGLLAAARDPTLATARRNLGITGVEILGADAYARFATMRHRAQMRLPHGLFPIRGEGVA